MYIKLALRNLRRSARDYGIYFLTVAVTVALMESFLALACARDVLSLSENMGILTTGIVGVSVLVALLSSCVIAYGVGFMLGQRKQEFALYQLMGMELRTVQRMFFWENGLLGLAAFGLGALLGTGLAGVLAQGVWWIFQTPPSVPGSGLAQGAGDDLSAVSADVRGGRPAGRPGAPAPEHSGAAHLPPGQ